MPKYELQTTAEVVDYDHLRSYVGRSDAVSVSRSASPGVFAFDPTDTSTADDGEDTIVGHTGKRWKRVSPPGFFLQSGTGAVARTFSAKARDYASPEDFGAVGDGVTDDITALTNALASGKKIIGQRGKTYKIGSTLTITDKDVDSSGATILYTGAKNAFAMVINANGSTFNAAQVRNFLLKLDSSNTDTTDRTHGLCLSGNLGLVDGFRIEGFTGISLALGSGSESYTGVTLPGSQQCYYWEVANGSVASTAGWNLVVPSANNANYFRNFATFPWNGFNESAPRTANCIDEVVVGGTCNVFARMSLEASPSGTMVKFLATAQGNEFTGQAYLERNTNWATPPFPRLVALAESSGNIMRVRHPYAGDLISDLGTANDIRAVPAFYINGMQVVPPSAGVNMVRNGRFENGATNWTDLSVNGTLSYGTGYLSGKSMRVDVVSGRPHISQDLVAVGGYSITALRSQNITVSGYVRTNLADASIKCAALTQNRVRSDEVWQYFVATVKVPAAATAVAVILITESSSLTGYVEWSDVTAVIGNNPLALGTRDHLEGSATYNPASLADGAGATTTVTCTGAALGDFVTGVSFGVDLQGITLTGWVSAADTVSVRFQNETGGTLDLASSTLRVRVQKAT